jgi:Cu-Zn family superoxide dismutase
MRHPIPRLLGLSLALALAGCGAPDSGAGTADPTDGPVPETAATPSADTASTPDTVPGRADVPQDFMGAGARAVLTATEGNAVTGDLRFDPVDGGVRITGQVSGLTPDARHGFHVHETGDCSAPDGTSAGGHFNPASTAHGRVGQGDHHVGDSDNLQADATGVATVDNRLEGATLGDGGASDIIGKAVIVHADADDYATQPTGNAGARLACGVIGPVPDIAQ